MQQDLIRLEVGLSTIQQLRSVLTPGTVGAIGRLRGTLQDLVQQGNEVAAIIDSARQSTISEIARRGDQIDLAKFDPNVDAVQSLSTILAYMTSRAIQGGGGRAISDKDLELAMRAVGDPKRLLANLAQVNSRLNTLESFFNSEREIILRAMGQQEPAGAAPSGSTGTSVEVIRNPDGTFEVRRK